MPDTAATLELMRAVFDSFRARDEGAFRALLTDDAELDLGGTGVTVEGSAEVARAVAFTFAAIPDLAIEVRTMFADGERGVAEVVRTGTHTGSAVRLPECALFTVRAGKVARLAVYSDRAHTAQQLGTEVSIDD